MGEVFRGRFGSLTFHKWVRSIVEFLIEKFVDIDIPEYDNSFLASQGGLFYNGVYKSDGKLKLVGAELAKTIISFPSTAGISISAGELILVDPYGRNTYSSSELIIEHTGIAGDGILLTDPDHFIEINSADIVGHLNTSTPADILIGGSPSIVGIYAPSSSGITAESCASLESVVAPNAVSLDLSGAALTAQSIEDLLVSLEAAGNEDGSIDISGGTSATWEDWSNIAQSALQNLETDLGWTTNYNGKIII